jgi:hypothetical protein
MAETRRYEIELRRLGISVGGTVVNRVAEPDAIQTGPGRVFVPVVPGDLIGIDGLRRVSRSASPNDAISLAETAEREAAKDDPSAAGGDSTIHHSTFNIGVVAAFEVGSRYIPPLDRQLYFIGGKGGVGKTTVASALGFLLAETMRGQLDAP